VNLLIGLRGEFAETSMGNSISGNRLGGAADETTVLPAKAASKT
jgi:hypothetical protein